jgi:crotonobetainyl-CoA:carnitine CoA-transferase CaiB-like acyl-CoA transferase
MGNYRTSDGGTINFCILTPGPYIRDTFEHLGIPEAAEDPRFARLQRAHRELGKAASALIVQGLRQALRLLAQHLKTIKGQWAPVQSLLDLSTDEQALANDMLFEVEAADGGPPIKLVRGPVQFNHAPVETTRARRRPNTPKRS